MFRLFLSDLVEKRKVILSVGIAVFFSVYLQSIKIPAGETARQTVLLIFIVGTVYTAFQTVQAYFNFDRIKGYCQLPIQSKTVFFLFSLSLYSINIIERMLLTIVFCLAAGLSVDQILVEVLLFSAICIQSIILLFLLKGRENKGTMLLVSFLLALFSAVNILYHSIQIKLILFFIAVGCLSFGLSNFRLEDALYQRDRQRGRDKISRNYFSQLFFQGRTAKINLLFALALVTFMLVINDKSMYPLMMPLLFTLGSINTPVTTMLSSDRELRTQLAMLPAGKEARKMYLLFLFNYFLCVNLVVCVITFFFSGIDLRVLASFALLLSIFEAPLFTFIEFRFPVKGWKIESDVWKHPRKYISLLFVFLLSSILYMILAGVFAIPFG